MEAINRQTWKQRMASYKRTPLSFLLLVLVTASALFTVCIPVSYTHLTLPTIYDV